MKRILVWIFAVLFCICLTGCFSISVTSSDDEEKILEAIKINCDAFNNEDIDAYMSVITGTEEFLEMVRNSTLETFKTYEAKLELPELKVTKKDGLEAEVSFTQITKWISGPEFKDYKSTGIHYLKKVDGKWKIYKSETLTTEGL